jgi:predicted transcriptional regulator
VEEIRPDRPLRLVLRCFDPDLANRVHAISEAYTLLSSAEVAAPIFVREALNQPQLS